MESEVKVRRRFSPSPDVEYRPYFFESSEYIDRFMNMLPVGEDGTKCKFTTSSVGDFNLFGVRNKIPTVVFGPGGDNIHAANEYVNRDEIIRTANYISGFLLEVF